jgi:hypothetical protein
MTGSRHDTHQTGVIAMSFLTTLLNYGDRIAISVAAPFILEEFDFSPVAWGVSWKELRDSRIHHPGCRV